MNNFSFENTKIKDLKIIKNNSFKDNRGSLARVFCNDFFSQLGWNKPIAQINYTSTKNKGTVKGMHYQIPPLSELKIVRCIKGKIFDVVVDLRKESKTFMKWHSEILTEDNGKCTMVLEGFAHGYQSLSDNCDIIYCHSAPYSKDHERAINPLDKLLGINWPIEISLISQKDKNIKMIDENFIGIDINNKK